jgi:hypothetical protein
MTTGELAADEVADDEADARYLRISSQFSFVR